MAGSKKLAPSLRQVRSAISSGNALILGDLDERSAWARRLKDLLHGLEADLGGGEGLSEGQRAIIRRAGWMEMMLEQMEAEFASQDGIATPRQLARYQRTANSQRRLFESLGLHEGRRQRDVTHQTLDEIAEEIARDNERATA